MLRYFRTQGQYHTLESKLEALYCILCGMPLPRPAPLTPAAQQLIYGKVQTDPYKDVRNGAGGYVWQSNHCLTTYQGQGKGCIWKRTSVKGKGSDGLLQGCEQRGEGLRWKSNYYLTTCQGQGKGCFWKRTRVQGEGSDRPLQGCEERSGVGELG